MYWGRHLVKMLRAVDVLARPGGVTIDELGRSIDVDRRTAYRIKETLEELNFPLYADQAALDGKVRYRLMDSYLKKLPNLSVPELNLTLSEVIALYFIRGSGRVFRGTEIETDIEAAFAKLDAFMPEGLAAKLDRIKTLFTPASRYTKDYSGKQEIIETLTEAMFALRPCQVEYLSFHDQSVRSFQIEPLSFFERDGGLYAFVCVPKYGNIRVLAVERIISLTPGQGTFEPSEDFDPGEYLDGAFSIIYDDPTDFRIVFSAEVARYIGERRWGKDQKITERPDGSILLELRTSGWIEVRKWILSYGPDAEVLEPEMMREEVAEALQRAAARYHEGSICIQGGNALKTHSGSSGSNEAHANSGQDGG